VKNLKNYCDIKFDNYNTVHTFPVMGGVPTPYSDILQLTEYGGDHPGHMLFCKSLDAASQDLFADSLQVFCLP
jgi:hypothetical protein